MKKRLITVVLMVCMALSLVACSKPGTPVGTEGTELVPDEVLTPDNQVLEEPDDPNAEEVEYKVIVVDAKDKPVAGQMVQICNDDTFFSPAVTDFDGAAVFTLKKSNKYKVKLMTAPDDAYVAFEAGKTEITLKLAE